MHLDDSIDKALEADRAAIPADDPASRARLIDMLDALPPAAGAPAGGLLSAGVAKIVAIGVAALGLGSGLYFLPDYFERKTEAPVVRKATPTEVATPSLAPAPPATAPETASQMEVPSAPVSVPAAVTPPNPLSRREGEPEGVRETAVIEKPKTIAPKSVEPAVAARDTAAPAEPVVITRDSVNVEVRMNMDGLK